MIPLLLSIFPGIGMLDMAFEEQGFCVVRGPDVLWGGDIRRFHPPTGRFDGVIGGPPCQAFSRIRFVNPRCGAKHGNLIPEFERCVSEAKPSWFLMENVEGAPIPAVDGYAVSDLLLNNRWLGEVQSRLRRFSFGVRGDEPVALRPEVAVFESVEFAHAACASGGRRAVPIALVQNGSGGHKRKKDPLKNYGYAGRRSLVEHCRLQGLPDDFLADAPFTVAGKVKVIGNGVPLPMGRAIAKAVAQATGHTQ